MVNVLGATGSLLPVLLSSKTLADKPPVAPISTCGVQRFPLWVVTCARRGRPIPRTSHPNGEKRAPPSRSGLIGGHVLKCPGARARGAGRRRK